jgi:DNA replication protein DnaC
MTREIDWAKEIELQRRLSAVVQSPRYVDAMFDTYTPATKSQAQALEAAKLYASDFNERNGAGLFLIGPPGVGKTHLAFAVLRAMIESDIESGSALTYAFTDSHDLTDLFRQWPKRDESAAGRLEAADVLIVDDLQVLDERTVQGFEWLVERRYRHRRPAIVTSNLLIQRLREAIGDRSYDRLRDGVVLCKMDGMSHRGRYGWEGAKARSECSDAED